MTLRFIKVREKSSEASGTWPAAVRARHRSSYVPKCVGAASEGSSIGSKQVKQTDRQTASVPLFTTDRAFSSPSFSPIHVKTW